MHGVSYAPAQTSLLPGVLHMPQDRNPGTCAWSRLRAGSAGKLFIWGSSSVPLLKISLEIRVGAVHISHHVHLYIPSSLSYLPGTTGTFQS